jgi:hypothetical protein
MDVPFSETDHTSGSAPSEVPQSSKRRPAPRGTAAYPRKRAVTACQVCRSRRTKCDNKKPSCSFCEQVGAKCITSSVDLSPFDPASLKILERLDHLEDILLSFQPPQVSIGTNDVIPIESPPEFHLLRISVTDVLSWPVFEGRFDLHLDVKSLLRRIPLDKTVHSPASDSYAAINDLDSRAGLKLLEAFLQHVHVKNPILDEAKIYQMVHRVSLEGFGWDPESCLVLLVYALGSIASSFNGASTSDLTSLGRANSYFNASQKRIGTLIGRGGVLEAQCFFFSGVYLMSALQPIHAWRHFVQALACCQEFDFATQSLGVGPTTVSCAPRGPPAEESVYWTCWKSELEVRQHLQLPDFTIKDHVYPRLFPTPPTESAQEEHREWYFYLAEISLRRLETRIRNEICHTQRPDNDQAYVELSEAVPSYEDQVNTWIHSLPDIMSLQTPEADDDVLKFILRGHLMNFYEVIYWPFVEAVINQQQRSVVVKGYAEKGLQCCLERIRLNKPGFTHRHHGTWFMLQSCTRSALVLLAAARTTDITELIPDRWSDAVFDVIKMLRFWEHEIGDAGDRLRILEDILESVQAGDTAVNL